MVIPIVSQNILSVALYRTVDLVFLVLIPRVGVDADVTKDECSIAVIRPPIDFGLGFERGFKIYDLSEAVLIGAELRLAIFGDDLWIDRFDRDGPDAAGVDRVEVALVVGETAVAVLSIEDSDASVVLVVEIKCALETHLLVDDDTTDLVPYVPENVARITDEVFAGLELRHVSLLSHGRSIDDLAEYPGEPISPFLVPKLMFRDFQPTDATEALECAMERSDSEATDLADPIVIAVGPDIGNGDLTRARIKHFVHSKTVIGQGIFGRIVIDVFDDVMKAHCISSGVNSTLISWSTSASSMREPPVVNCFAFETFSLKASWASARL